MESLTTPIQKITFTVSDVEPAEKLLSEMPFPKALELRLRCKVEGCSNNILSVVPHGGHEFVGAAYLAFNDHRPLVISPDHIWLLICQGFAIHVHENAEALRHQFVAHDGKQEINIMRKDIHKGQADAPWDDVIAQFSHRVQSFILTDLYQTLTPKFSTTTPTDTTAFEVAFLDAVQEYFSLSMTLCGIPSITLEGSPEDWRNLRENMRKLGSYNLDWWVRVLEPILDEFVLAAEGQINKAFWQDFYKFKERSGGPFITGWLLKFFPYIEEVVKKDSRWIPTYRINPYLERLPEDYEFQANHIPSGLSHVPFKWDYGTTTYDMKFLAGFIGISQDKATKALRPEISWAVYDTANIPKHGIPKHILDTLPQDVLDSL